MSETEKREESQEHLNGSSDMHPAGTGAEASIAPREEGAADRPSNESQSAAADVEQPAVGPGGIPGEDNPGEFAEHVILGLEQACLSVEEKENYDTPSGKPGESGSGTGAEPEDSIVWADIGLAEDGEKRPLPEDLWTFPEFSFTSSGLSGSAEENDALEHPAGEPGLHTLPEPGVASWNASGGSEEGGASGESREEAPSLRSLSGESAIWDDTKSPGDDEALLAGEASLRSLSEMGESAGHGGDFAGDAAKHDALADAVRSALQNVYGEASAQASASAAPIFQKLPFQDGGIGGNIAGEGASPPGDNLSPQDVILNYFDYTPEAQDTVPLTPASDGLTPQEVILNYFDYPGGPSPDGSAPHAPAAAKPSYENDAPASFRKRMEAAEAPQGRSSEDYPSQRPEWQASAPQPGQYSGPPAFPVPAAASAEPRPGMAGQAGQENSRLLGAAAIGLMGGIAIAASLAAFLIYGPHPAAVEIPGVGSLRLDKDEQGYGGAEETAREFTRNAAARPAGEFSSEILAADAVTSPGQPVPLAITVKSQQPFEKMLVSISGVPEGGRLNAGVDAGGGVWLLPPPRLNGLTLSLPEATPSSIPLEAQLLDSNARTPLSAKAAFSVRVNRTGAASPAAHNAAPATASLPSKPAQQPALLLNTQTVPEPPAPGAQAPVPDASFKTQTVAPFSQAAATASLGQRAVPGAQDVVARKGNWRPEAEDLIREGNKRMRDGEILEARQFYQKAVALGDADAALAMGRSYDPIYFARIDKKNAEPDAAKAFDWYRRAMDAGVAQAAMVRIENLRRFLNENEDAVGTAASPRR